MQTYISDGRRIRTPENIQDITLIYNWCEQYMKDFLSNEDFDFYACLTDIESRSQKIYGLCVDFTHNVKELTERFMKDRDKLTFS